MDKTAFGRRVTLRAKLHIHGSTPGEALYVYAEYAMQWSTSLYDDTWGLIEPHTFEGRGFR